MNSGAGLPAVIDYDRENNTITIIDQTRLPMDLVLKDLKTIDDVYLAIKNLEVRGAPAIGLVAAYGLVLYAHTIRTDDRLFFWGQMRGAATYLKSARPTAVNLSRDVDMVMSAFQRLAGAPVDKIINDIEFCTGLLKSAIKAAEEAIGRTGASLLEDGDLVMTHCNAGVLATGGAKGTALAPIYRAREEGKTVSVIACETRPVLQGMRLTAFELAKNQVPVRLITDSMAGICMKTEPIKGIFVGADRITANGDVANKIGTYSLAVLAQAHGIPFYVCAPTSTIDLSLETGSLIPIEERDPGELTQLWFEENMQVPDVTYYNPAFDVTPYELVTGGIITEHGFWKPGASHG
ncbi:S-methyl-5-thioribose-1-phosphate isomerase [Peptococcus simiae]|uniref:Methylthioribose-1-phosphate isomerase n=1 Tax=Peptococcus simiae TaxID=1643805 RepID=A0ABW9GX53_9FIRM